MNQDKKIVVGNWKMNPASEKEAKDLFNKVTDSTKEIENTEVVICPPFIYIPLLKSELSKNNQLGENIKLGSQDVFFEDKGAFTGEVSSEMLLNLKIEYVIVGHSERRKFIGETDEVINKKIKKSLEEGLKVILCVGETKEEKEKGKTKEVLENQIKKGLKEVLDKSNLIIAYEPVWSIGTGDNCPIKTVREMITFIKDKVNCRVLYGGSVNSENSKEYKDISDGLLVGGASLKADEFIRICKK